VRSLLRNIATADPAGVWIADVRITPDGQYYAYGYAQELDELYLLKGMK
jgi:hypothetical protein